MTDDVPPSTGYASAGLPKWKWGEDLCAPFVQLLPVSGASICVFHGGGGHATVCTSDPLATRLDAMQFELGEGPRWVVSRTTKPEISFDPVREAPSAWPVFAAGAVALGVRALFAYPITIGAIMIGAVDLYRRTPGALDRAATAQVLSLARQVAGPAAQEALRSAHSDDVAEGSGAPALRREVHQAVGMVFVQLDVTTGEALALLRARAFATGRSLEDIARAVVDRRLDFRDLPG